MRLHMRVSNDTIFTVKPEKFTNGLLIVTNKCSNLRVGFTKL